MAVDLEGLRRATEGTLVGPGDPGYDEARSVWNGMIDRRPAGILRAASVGDIATGLRFAREHDLRVGVRGGGHNVAGTGAVEGGLLLDLGGLASVSVDAATGVARTGPGATLGVVDAATQAHGLAVPVGVVTGTGIAGLTLGGGFGWLTRTYGLSLDNLLAADVLLADGATVRASATSESELFWGLRGGGGNFGIVTGFEFQAHPIGPEVFAGALIHERPRWADALRAFDAWTMDIPDELTPVVSFLAPPPSWDLGSETLMITGFAWAGPHRADGEHAIAPFRRACPADVELLDPTTWLAWQSSVDEVFPKGVRAYWKNATLDALGDGAIEMIVAWASRLPTRRSGFDIHAMGGAVARVPDDATAFPNRTARFLVNMYAVWDEPADDDRGKAWARGFHAALRAHAATGQYVNFLALDPTAGDPVAAARATALEAYGPAKFARLVALKGRFDPDNVFRLNHNIPPGG